MLENGPKCSSACIVIVNVTMHKRIWTIQYAHILGYGQPICFVVGIKFLKLLTHIYVHHGKMGNFVLSTIECMIGVMA